MEKKPSRKKSTSIPPEKYFGRAVEEYFAFHKDHYRDEDGFRLSPNWNDVKAGMERRSLKFILQTLRQISEGKKIEWTEEQMVINLNRFMEKSHNHQLVRKNFMCCMMNRFKFDILSSSYDPNLSKKLREIWYFENPEYTRDDDKDRAASEVIVGFLKQQYVLASVEFTEDSVLQSWRVIIRHIKQDEFWNQKSLKSISNNMQEFVNRIKSNRNGKRVDAKTGGIEYAINKALRGES